MIIHQRNFRKPYVSQDGHSAIEQIAKTRDTELKVHVSIIVKTWFSDNGLKSSNDSRDRILEYSEMFFACFAS